MANPWICLADTVTKVKPHDQYQYIPTQLPIDRFQPAVNNEIAEMTIPVQVHLTHPTWAAKSKEMDFSLCFSIFSICTLHHLP
jgi:hypothetical protein